MNTTAQPPFYTPPGMDYSPFYTWGQGTGQGAAPVAAAAEMPAQNSISSQLMALLEQRQAPVTGFAKHANTFGTIAQGLSGLGSMWLGYQGLKQQKKAFEFNKGVVNTNLNNSIMDYNRRLGDTLSNRALNNGQGQGWVSQQLAQYSARRS